MLEKIDGKEEQFRKFKAKHKEQSTKFKRSTNEIKVLNVEKEKLSKSLKEENDKLKKPPNYCKDKASRHIKDSILLMKLAKDELQALLDIRGCDMVTTFESGCYISRIREISFTLLGMNVGWNVCLVIVSVIKQLTNINLAGSFSTVSTTEFICRSPNTCKAMHQWQC